MGTVRRSEITLDASELANQELQTQFVNVWHQFRHVAPWRHEAMPKKNFPPKVGDGRFEVQDKLGEARHLRLA